MTQTVVAIFSQSGTRFKALKWQALGFVLRLLLDVGSVILSLLKLEQEIRLFSTNQDRETFETMADLYSIFIATENLEKAYIRDTVNHDE